MRKVKLILLLLVATIWLLNGQSLGKERVDKLKQTVVRVLINGQASGTGFFISKNGTVASCWHVIAPIIVQTNENFAESGIIEVEFPDHKNYLYEVSKKLQGKAIHAKVNDYVILEPRVSVPNVNYWQLGDFSEAIEGDEVYTCGYPLGDINRFISKGILSTKFLYPETYNGKQYFTDVAYLDLTINRGNSGGPLIKMGKNLQEDRVVGISSFIITPFKKELDKIQDTLKVRSANSPLIMGINPTLMFSDLIEVINFNSIGISGCHSINYVKSKIN